MELTDRIKARFSSRWRELAGQENAQRREDPVAVRTPDRPKAFPPSPRRAAGNGQPEVESSVPALTEPTLPTEIKITETSVSASDQAVPSGLRVAAAWAWRVFLVAGLIYFIGWILGFLSQVVIPLAIAILLAAMLKPVANKLHEWGLGRGLASAVTLLGGIALIAGTLSLIINSIANQASELGQQVVTGFNQLVSWLENGPLPIDDTWFRLDEWGSRIQQFLIDSQSTIAAYAGQIGTSVGHFLAGVAICLFSLFYFLYDGRGIFTFLLKFIPRIARERADRASLGGWRSLSSYVRATILVASVDALGVLVVALILRVPLAPALAALVFLGGFIPLVGAFVSGFVAVLVALVAVGWVPALIMLAGIIVVMQLEGHVLQPFLLGRAVKLHPLAVLLAIAIGIIIAGIVGALLAVPILAFVKTFIQELYRIDREVVPPARAPEPPSQPALA